MGFVDGLETPGNPGSLFKGTVSKALNSNTISQIVIPSHNSPPHGSDTEPNYNFGETLPAAIAGSVYLDDNNNGIREAGEPEFPRSRLHSPARTPSANLSV